MVQIFNKQIKTYKRQKNRNWKRKKEKEDKLRRIKNKLVYYPKTDVNTYYSLNFIVIDG